MITLGFLYLLLRPNMIKNTKDVMELGTLRTLKRAANIMFAAPDFNGFKDIRNIETLTAIAGRKIPPSIDMDGGIKQ